MTYYGKRARPKLPIPQIGDVLENLNTGRVLRIVEFVEQDDEIKARTETIHAIARSEPPRFATIKHLTDPYTFKRREK